MKNRRLALLVLIFTTLVIGFNNCGKAKFTQVTNKTEGSSQNPNGGPQPSPTDTTCKETLGDNTENLKFIFMLDNSDSTHSTDPGKVFRSKVIMDFLTTYKAKTNFQYFLGYFNHDYEIYDKISGSFTESPTSMFENNLEMGDAVTKFISEPSPNGTKFRKAFDGIKLGLNTPDASTSKYIVVFMSDGMPTDLDDSISDRIQDAVDLVSGIKTERLTLSTIYFGSGAVGAHLDLLKAMAATGGGKFINTNETTEFKLDNVVTIPGTTCSK